jgi:hypothetical protein
MLQDNVYCIFQAIQDQYKFIEKCEKFADLPEQRKLNLSIDEIKAT